MPIKECDVVVIGEGLAGVIAAAAAASEGARTVLVSKGPGSFVLADGCVELRPRNGGTNELDGSKEDARTAVSFFMASAAAAGCEYRGGFEEKICIPTILGTFRQVSLAPLYVGACDLRRLRHVGVAGFDGGLDFDANFIAQRLAAKAKQEGLETSFTPRSLQLDGTHIEASQEFATRFDRDTFFRKSVVAALAKAAENAECLIIPGLLGLGTSTAELREIAAQVGCPICEIATLPPSILGMRLFRRLESYLTQVGVELLTGFAVNNLLLAKGICKGVELDTPARPRQIKAHAVVMAGGGFSHLLDNAVTSQVTVNKDLLVCDGSGQVLADNLFGCGGALQTSNVFTENAVAILTGVRAGKSASTLGVHHAER
jgi:glycerol-3-phosphate dehydrogenase subunit B